LSTESSTESRTRTHESRLRNVRLVIDGLGEGSVLRPGGILDPESLSLDVELRLCKSRPIRDDSWKSELPCNTGDNVIVAQRWIIDSSPYRVDFFDPFTGELLIRVAKYGRLMADIKTPPLRRWPVQRSCPFRPNKANDEKVSQQSRIRTACQRWGHAIASIL